MSEKETPDVGLYLRTLRQERGLSLRALAELCELSPNTISLIERGETSPSVSTLHRLATALGVHVSNFFVEPADRVRTIYTPADKRVRSGSASVVLESLGWGLEGQACDPFIVTLKPGAHSGRLPMVHAGTELIHVFEGKLSIEVATQNYLLKPGDTLLFRGEQPHRWQNPNSSPAIFLMMMQASEERDEKMHQHLHP